MTSAVTPLAAVPMQGAKLSAEFIQVIGSNSFFDDFGEVVGRIAPFDSLLFFLYRPDAAPILLANTCRTETFQQGLDNFLDHTYLLNPVYQAFKSAIPTGAYLMPDLMPDGYGELISGVEFEIRIDIQETIGYRTPGWPKHMQELLLLANLPDGSMVEVTIQRRQETGFKEQELSRFKTLIPMISAVIGKHWELMNQDFSAHESRPSLDGSFDEFGSDVLTDREKEVVKLVLTGHSSDAISLKLGTSVPTIKTHRRNIYSKLEVGSQAELFSRFIEFLTSKPRD